MLPKINQKFRTFFEPALKYNTLWRLVVGMIILFAVYFVFVTLIFGGLGVYVGVVSEVGTLNGQETGDVAIEAFFKSHAPLSVIILLTSFIGMFLGVLIAVKLMHKRGLRSLLGPNMVDVIQGFRNGFVFLTVLTLIGLAVFSLIDPPTQNMEFSTWLFWMIFCVPLLFLQVFSEELVFRGYLQQQLAARFKSRWAWYVLPSVIFGLMHYDSQTMGSNAWLVVVQTTLFGLIAAEVTARTGNLGLAIGLHFANNIFALTVVTLNGAFASGLGLFTTAVHVSDEQAVRSLLIFDLFFIAVLYGLFLLWCQKRPQL